MIAAAGHHPGHPEVKEKGGPDQRGLAAVDAQGEVGDGECRRFEMDHKDFYRGVATALTAVPSETSRSRPRPDFAGCPAGFRLARPACGSRFRETGPGASPRGRGLREWSGRLPIVAAASSHRPECPAPRASGLGTRNPNVRNLRGADPYVPNSPPPGLPTSDAASLGRPKPAGPHRFPKMWDSAAALLAPDVVVRPAPVGFHPEPSGLYNRSC